MEQIKNFLLSLRGDVFKLLPMKESEIKGLDNHIADYTETVIVNLTGSLQTYPELQTQKQYLYVLNNIQYLQHNPVDFKTWRKIILNSTRSIDNLYVLYGGSKDEK